MTLHAHFTFCDINNNNLLLKLNVIDILNIHPTHFANVATPLCMKAIIIISFNSVVFESWLGPGTNYSRNSLIFS